MTISEDIAAFADDELDTTRDQSLSAEQTQNADTRILLSFQRRTGGIACRDDKEWKIEALREGSRVGDTDYRMAGSVDSEILAIAQEMAVGQALDAEAEASAKVRGWR